MPSSGVARSRSLATNCALKKDPLAYRASPSPPITLLPRDAHAHVRSRWASAENPAGRSHAAPCKDGSMSSPRHVSIVLFENFELLDAFGPIELLSRVPDDITITLIGPAADPVRSFQGT